MSEAESEEERRRKEEERRAWLGEPIEHGGGYRAPSARIATMGPEFGCCAFQAIGSAALLLGMVSLSAYSLLS